MKPVRDPDGVILNTEALTANQVALERARCPACGNKVFDQWPLGWDAHAAHRCNGLRGGSPKERKAEFKTRFRHLFR